MDIKTQCATAASEIIEKAKLKKGDILVVGCSTSEIVGSKIGTNSDPATAKTVFDTIYSVAKTKSSVIAKTSTTTPFSNSTNLAHYTAIFYLFQMFS